MEPVEEVGEPPEGTGEAPDIAETTDEEESSENAPEVDNELQGE